MQSSGPVRTPLPPIPDLQRPVSTYSGSPRVGTSPVVESEKKDLPEVLPVPVVSPAMLTSLNAPLNPNWLAVAGIRGKMALMAAPGRLSHRFHRDLACDLTRLRDVHQVTTVFSVMEESDYPAVYGGQTQAQVQQIYQDHQMTQMCYYIVNQSIPTEKVNFDALIEKMLVLLSQGQNIGIHCIHGKGRTGLVAASCLVKLGYAPKLAINMVRYARRGTVSHKIQERFVKQYARWLQL